MAGVKAPKKLVLFGAGAQVTQHANIFLQLYSSIRTCSIINRSINPRLTALADTLGAKFPDVAVDYLALSDKAKVEAALADADLVCCATSSTEALFADSWLKASAHVNLVSLELQALFLVDASLLLPAN